ncbi:VOC family protein [Cryptosporangium sp. NPDC051539]|uniref:VOC family protein n=1 Tax=Cryptosporangium sp. NPDC051539 TaxID=3363962 RepID=UPI0037AC9FB0
MTGHRGAVLDHVAVETTGIEADVALMTRTFGLTELRWGVHVQTGKRIVMLRDSLGMKLELIETVTPDGSLAHVAFEVTDVEVAAAAAIGAGCLGEIGLIRIPAAMASAAVVRSRAGTALQLIRYEDGSPDVTRPAAPETEAVRGPEGTTS